MSRKLFFIIIAVGLFCFGVGAHQAHAATVTPLSVTTTTANSATSTSASFTPTAGDLLIVFVASTGGGPADPIRLTDTQGLGFGLAGTGTTNSGADLVAVYVAQTLAAATATTVTFQSPGNTDTGSVIFVAEVSGVTRLGPGALRQIQFASNQAAGTPAITFNSAALTGDPTLGFIANATNPATLSPPSGWTEQADVGYATPTTGAEYVTSNSGFTGTTVTWGGASASAWGGVILEVDTSAQTAYQYPNVPTGAPGLAQIRYTDSGVTSGETLNGIKISLPHPSMSGNTLVLALTWGSGNPIASITDNASNTWVLAKSGGDSDQTSAVYYVDNAASGTLTLTITFTTSLAYQAGCQMTLAELYGVATASVVDASSINTSTAQMIQAGPMTTTQSGDLIFMYGMSDYFAPEQDRYAAITAGNNFALAAANLNLGMAAEVGVQASAGSIDPEFDVSDNTSDDNFNAIAVAFKANPSAGTAPSGIRIVHEQGYAPDGYSNTEFPSTGNMTLLTTTYVGGGFTMTNVTDNNGNSYSQTPNPNNQNYSWAFYDPAAVTSPNLTLNWTQTNGSGFYTLYDIAGAATSPFDTYTYATGAGVPANADVTDAADYTPTVSSTELVFDLTQFGNGPPSGVIATGTVFDSVWGTGMIDASQYNTGDGYSHYLSNSTATIPFGWHMANGTSTNYGALDFGFFQAPPTNYYTVTSTTELVVAGSLAPTISSVAINNGNAITLTAATTTPIPVGFTITDSLGCSAVFSGGNVTTTLYRSTGAATSTCAANNASCYITTSVANNCTSGTTANATATFNVYYFANSTGNASSSFPTSHWYATVSLLDTGGATTTATSTSRVDVGVLTAISLSTSSINYGTILPGNNTNSTDQIVTVQNAGNSSTTLQLSASATLTLGVNSIATSSQAYSTSTFTYPGTSTALSATPTTVSGFLLTTPTSTGNVAQSIYWGLAIPLSTPKGNYTGTTAFSSLFSP